MEVKRSFCSLSPLPVANAVLDHITHPVSCWSEELDFLYGNKAWLDLFSVTSTGNTTYCLTNPHSDIYPKIYPDVQPCERCSEEFLREQAQKALLDGKSLFSFIFMDNEGKEFSADVTMSKVQAEQKKYILLQCHPILLDGKHLASLINYPSDETWVRSILDSTLTNSTLWDDNYNLIDCSKFRYSNFGVDKITFMENFFSFCPEYQENGLKSTEAVKLYLQEALSNGYATHNWEYLKDNGCNFSNKILFVRVSVRQKNYVLCFTLDSISGSQVFSTTLMENYERMRLLLRHLPIGVDLWNKNFELYDCNEASLHYFGITDKEDYLKNFMDFTPEFQPSGLRSKELIGKYLQIAFEKGHYQFEWLHVNRKGEELPTQINIFWAKDEKNEDVAIVYYSDLREVKRNIDSIKKDGQRLSDILNSAPYAITTWNKDFLPTDCNLSTLELLGFESTEDFVQNFLEILPEKQKDGTISQEIFIQTFQTAFGLGHAFVRGELRNRKTNSLISVELTFKKLILNGIEQVIIYLTDLTLQAKMMQEIQESHEALTLARDAAEKNSKVKSEFLANMSHEIRTPMNGILGLIHLLRFTELTKQQQSYADKVLFSAESLLRIINDILDFSKIEAGKLEMEHVPFTLAELKEELCMLFEAKLAGKNIRAEIFSENILDTRLLGDPLRLKQVFLNLVGNAIKFTEKGSIYVYIDDVYMKDATHIVYTFTVKDSGIGLSREQSQRLFNAFSQADTSTTRKYGGTGLGLIISKRIVEMMQGNIWVNSELGKGSAFSFNVTLELDESHQQPFLDAQVHVFEQMKSNRIGRILLVEDNEINQLIALELIAAKGHSVDIAHNGQEALNMLETNEYDLVFMDIQMPVMDGLTATKKIREQSKFKELPIIAMSAHAMKGDREISLNHGMNEHLSKPIQPEALYACMNTWIL